MTASELKYLIAANELSDNGNGARMAAMAARLGVSKVSVCKAVERLTESGYLCQNGKRVLLTERGIEEIADYMIVVDFIGNKLQRHCNTPKETAFIEAVGATCALGDESRKRVLAFAKKQAVN